MFEAKVIFDDKKQKTIRLMKKSKQQIAFKDVKEYYDDLLPMLKKDAKDIRIRGMKVHNIAVTGLNNERMMTLKNFDDDTLRELDSDDYYVNKYKQVKNVSHVKELLTNYEYIDIYVNY